MVLLWWKYEITKKKSTLITLSDKKNIVNNVSGKDRQEKIGKIGGRKTKEGKHLNIDKNSVVLRTLHVVVWIKVYVTMQLSKFYLQMKVVKIFEQLLFENWLKVRGPD